MTSGDGTPGEILMRLFNVFDINGYVSRGNNDKKSDILIQ